MLFRKCFIIVTKKLYSLRQTDYLNESIKLFAIPINKDKNFIYLKHDDTLLNKTSKLIKSEKWTIEKSSKLWSKLNNSPNKLNKKIVALVKSYLNHIPWQENSLMTIPGEHYIAKRIKKKTINTNEVKDMGNFDTILSKTEFDKLEIKPTLEPINVYYMSNLLTLQDIKIQLNQLSQWGIKYHFKECIKCVIGLPFTIPLILIPIVPNVPGFYLLYRAYCNIKAYIGAKHLQKLIDDDLLRYTSIDDNLILMNKLQDLNEINSKHINDIVNKLNVVELEPVLQRALKQEKRKRLKQKHTYSKQTEQKDGS